MPGGDITPEQLIVIGEIARDFSLYTKITGGQRIDMFGARVDQLPAIWRRLVDGGMESGHAYGKALRTVKSCVGSDWCRYGQQDSVRWPSTSSCATAACARRTRSRWACPGCARECAEARGKDVGVIATENGWNLYVGGNGGMTPRHAQLLAGDLDDETLVRYIDRFLMFYIRTADRLQRTAPGSRRWTAAWITCVPWCATTRWAWPRSSRRRWRATSRATRANGRACSRIPEKLSRFVSFVNAPTSPIPPSHSPNASAGRCPCRSECLRLPLEEANELTMIVNDIPSVWTARRAGTTT